jgi:hypothetical protein
MQATARGPNKDDQVPLRLCRIGYPLDASSLSSPEHESSLARLYKRSFEEVKWRLC